MVAKLYRERLKLWNLVEIKSATIINQINSHIRTIAKTVDALYSKFLKKMIIGTDAVQVKTLKLNKPLHFLKDLA